MDQNDIEHSHLDNNGLSLHIAHIGEAEKGTVVFLHGFPEIWYSWRHQMVAAANAGFRAIAPDFRGYGLSDQPSDPEKSKWEDLIADLLAIFDAFSIKKAFVVGKDFGALPAYHMALLHPERVEGVVTLGVPFLTQKTPIEALQPGFYFVRWQEPGRAIADFSRFDVRTVIRNVYILFSRSELPVAAEDQEIMDLVDPSTPLPSWFTEEDLAAYTTLYEKSRFHFPIQVPYLKWNESFDMISNITTTPIINVPALLIMGEKDYCLRFPFMEEYIRSGLVKNSVPDLQVAFVPEGSHFVQEQFPEQVNRLLISFIDNLLSKSSSI